MVPNHARWRRLLTPAVVFAGLVIGTVASATDYSLTGFGTAGYAVSDMRSPYLRYIDKNGTTRTDSLLGLQAEAQFDPQWGATLQVVTSAPRYKDEGVATQVRWAFLSYRPDNEWLIRVGRLRVPFLLNTQNAEVGITYEQARLPVEVYSLLPVYDADGAAFSKTWVYEGSETTVDGYVGHTDINFRNPFPASPSHRLFPDSYLSESVNARGLIVTHTSGPMLFRAGVHRAVVKASGAQRFVDGFTPSPFPAPVPFGGILFQPGNIVSHLGINLVVIGADWQHDRWRLTGEYAHRIVNGTTIGIGSKSASGTVARAYGKWTPYFTYARLLSEPITRRLYQDLIATPVPLGAQGAPLFVPAAFHQILAGQVFVYDQYSIMIGSSYSISRDSKLKFEWMRTKVGLASVLVDGDVHHKSFNVFSMSYNFAF